MTDPKSLQALKWRCIGPARGGRVVAVAGDPNEPLVFYFGACAGGVWKTIDGGIYWRCVSDGFFTSASVGALAVAGSDSNVIYAGMGETTIRVDVSYGDGVYRSTDAGSSWTHLGLNETRHIGKICIHPNDPDVVYVAALGDAFGANEERGVFRSKDGGKTWQKVLYRNADVGAVDVSMDPNNPRILFATMWQTRRSFWNLSSGGPGSGLFRTFDGGDTWEELSGRNGLPDGVLGKIGASVSKVQRGRVYALIEAEGDKIGLYRTDNYGGRWIQVSQNRDLIHRPWYYTHVFADTGHADTVYVANQRMWKSTDGGASFTQVSTPHGDNHDLWIDPADPTRMIEGNDGGACITFNGGKSWSSIYNQNTAQFYRIDVDSQHPYRIYATQQDNTSISVPSASEWGVITLNDCTYPGTGESGFIVVDPGDPDVVYCGAIGYSPGGAGALQRYDHRTRQVRLVNVWPEESTGMAPKNMRYRFAWTFPLAFSPHDRNTLYAGGNHIFRSRDEGSSWTTISPDLSLNDPVRQDYSGGLTHENFGSEVHATCASVVESWHRKGEIWVSTDDGLVHVTRNDGGQWINVTPEAMPELAYVGCVEISSHDADTVYVAVTRYKLADYQPYLFRTRDGGRSWQSIVGDFPIGEITRVVRADPVRPGLLFVGTETGVFFSLDDGAHWARVAGGLPVVPVYDLKIKGSDLVAGTHGRSLWILDDVAPLRELAVDQKHMKLVSPRPTIRTKLSYWAGTRTAKAGISYTEGIAAGREGVELEDGWLDSLYLDCGENPPNGAIVYYWLPKDAEELVKLTFQDAAGKTIVAFSSDDQDAPFHKKPGTKVGLNRFVWDLKHPGPAKLDQSLVTRKYEPLAPGGDPSGPTVVPGSYKVELQAGGKVQTVDFTVVKDPRIATTEKEFAEQFALLEKLFDMLSALNQAVNRIRLLKRQLADAQKRLGENDETLSERAQALVGQLEVIEGTLVDIKRETPQDARHPAGLNDTLMGLIDLVEIADAAPTLQARQVSDEIMQKVDGQIKKLEGLVDQVTPLNAALRSAGVELLGPAKP
ncbi:MAG: glycosyl hydrolase [Mesorhizobium sp.]|uniref:VPS10 domain-containing protein n=4 Tax=unclassified Mesorhizobium TaxID=325217 RepID=UPI000FCBDE0E|nr:glycosyl hydrolase [Mesorhizobium sp. M1A.F.Ca.IN.020.03.1.1]RUW03108.1 glycosyl hydrolase [Mesorhizobium sp. M1A.F.Ca.IN.020.04.1.1]RVD30891.1 glycosyl hydrolase [Mesorhizobium sp. M4B.F.Ca.ET.017.02.2.1]RWA66305.1 MAG: glycosyl hydrolase [Mesorhizobium sp.]TGQ09133.1 glycosyl hydrolase [Mesorhizobium sp. M4B.F.Ca.ET.215.01.1.1]TGQ25728.1 glycosyl hydrolase [Mesorhizobium sp. M00.F.Ca.ET.220.01.1.1]TGQ97936.1 glycosyl hydrolase [Mesorhizobium sp. M4B.F.Ca.ET.203.01.1.1]TGT38847.1 glycosy